jgi:hypothetical protein
MPLRSVQTVIGKAVVDRSYRDLLFTRPDEALKGHELTAEEIASLKGLSRETFDSVSSELEERMLAQVAGGVTATGLNPGQYELMTAFNLGRFGATGIHPQ